MSSEEVNEVKNEEATETVANEIIEEAPEKAPEEEIKEANEEQPKEEATPKTKATATKLPRTVKVVELVECNACKKDVAEKFKKHTPPLLQGATNRNTTSK